MDLMVQEIMDVEVHDIPGHEYSLKHALRSELGQPNIRLLRENDAGGWLAHDGPNAIFIKWFEPHEGGNNVVYYKFLPYYGEVWTPRRVLRDTRTEDGAPNYMERKLQEAAKLAGCHIHHIGTAPDGGTRVEFDLGDCAGDDTDCPRATLNSAFLKHGFVVWRWSPAEFARKAREGEPWTRSPSNVVGTNASYWSCEVRAWHRQEMVLPAGYLRWGRSGEPMAKEVLLEKDIP